MKDISASDFSPRSKDHRRRRNSNRLGSTTRGKSRGSDSYISSCDKEEIITEAQSRGRS
jgi:hypothetical protein